jgi:hypothetical protein
MARKVVFRALILSVVLATAPAWAGGVAILNTVLSDNGDGDGFADTGETVSLRFNVQNTSGAPLTDVKLHLNTRGPSLTCLIDSEVVVGNLAVGETRLTTDAAVFRVGSQVDRGTLGVGPLDDLSIGFDVLVSTASGSPLAIPSRLAFDLDLDVSGGSGPTTYFESFEAGLGTFEVENLDQNKLSLAASDGYRCQYNDPDWPNSNTYSWPNFVAGCYLGTSLAAADAIFWGISGPETSPLGGRAFSGFHSMFFGIDLGPPKNWTTPLASLEAARSIQPVHLGWNGIPPELSIKQQASLVDDRCASLPDGASYDRGVVMAQLADSSGAPVGPWIKLYPHHNTYDHAHVPIIINCAFDPIDDGSTEDSFFYPTDPARRYGPSSTCYPDKVFSNMGESSSPFGATKLGQADGPGLQGVWGIGTWIESRFDLGRFRGRNVRLRFLSSTAKVDDNLHDWEQAFAANPIPCDDGWWIDDVTVSGALATPSTTVSDAKDNSGLPLPPGGDMDSDAVYDVCDNCNLQQNPNQQDQDFDGLGDACDTCPIDPTNFDPDADGVCATPADNCPFAPNPAQTDGDADGAGLACDCNDSNPATHPGASEINDGLDNQCPGDSGYGVTDEISGLAGFFESLNKNKFYWPAQSGATRYQAARGNNRTFTVGCKLYPPTPQLFVLDTDAVPVGQIRFYLVRAVLPNKGSWGQNSAGQAIVVPCGP